MFRNGDWSAQFSLAQRRQLEQLGLLPEQIELLASVLELCKFAVHRFAPRDKVRSKLISLRRSAELFLSQLNRFLSDATAAGDEAELRVRLVDVSAINIAVLTAEDALLRARESVTWTIKVLKVAIESLPRKQQRYGPAKSFPIAAIDSALREGFRQHYMRHGLPMPPYKLKVSRSSSFAEVVRLCYEAVGYSDIENGCDPDRAIRTFLTRSSTQRSAGSPEMKSKKRATRSSARTSSGRQT